MVHGLLFLAAGTYCTFQQFKPVQVCSGFAVSGYYGCKVRGYFYLCLDSFGNAWEELLSQGGLRAFFPCFLSFY
jgi:hypothetical protein